MSIPTVDPNYIAIIDQAVLGPSRFPPPACSDVDRNLILGQIDRESGWGRYLDPAGPGGTGDGGHGRGFCQFDDRPPHASILPIDVYTDALQIGNWDWVRRVDSDGIALWAKPEFAIPRMVDQLRWNLWRLSDLEGAIAAYNRDLPTVRHVLQNLPSICTKDQKIALLDALTTGPAPGKPGNYVSDTLLRRLRFQVAGGGA